jgi:hypothetical protein
MNRQLPDRQFPDFSADGAQRQCALHAFRDDATVASVERYGFGTTAPDRPRASGVARRTGATMPTDAKQVALAEAFVANGTWVSHLAIAEASWVLASVYDRRPDAIATAIDMLLSHEHLTVQDMEVVASAVAQFRQQPRVGFSG